MTLSVFVAVLSAAFLHAAWNAVVKGSTDKHTSMLAVVLGHVPAGLLALPFAPAIDPTAIPWVFGGVGLHLCYQILLIAGYRAGDFTLVYPIARGSAPMIVMLVSIGAMGVSFTRFEVFGVAIIGLGLLCISFARHADESRSPTAVLIALCTGVFIAAYSLVDGIGADIATTALGYWCWAAIGNAIAFSVWTVICQPRSIALLMKNRNTVLVGLLGGTASFAAYGIVIWSYTQAPIALVAALRETSIVFALLIGVGILKERLDLARLASALVVVLGATLIRISRS